MSKIHFFHRTLTLVREYNNAIYDTFEQSIENGSSVAKVLNDEFEENHRQVLNDVYNYESINWLFYSNIPFSTDQLLKSRTQKLVQLNKVVKENGFDLFDFHFIINEDTMFVESEFNWCNYEFDTQNDSSSNKKSQKSFNTLIKKSLIEGLTLDEIPIQGFDAILLDLNLHNAPISGWDIFNSITETNGHLDENNLIQLKRKVHDKLLAYIIVFDALSLQENVN